MADRVSSFSSNYLGDGDAYYFSSIVFRKQETHRVNLLTRLSMLVVLCLIALMIFTDASPHFDRGLIGKKRSVWSAQRNWNLFLDQDYIYRDTSIRYEQDLKEISKLSSINEVAFTDLATSYYLAANTPLAVKNIHPHQGRNADRVWRQLLRNRDLCFLDDPDRLAKVKALLLADPPSKLRQRFKYIVVNTDSLNYNLKRDCFSQRSVQLQTAIEGIASLVFDGEYLKLYQIH